LDLETILNSVARTGRLLIVDESFGPCGIGAEIAAQITIVPLMIWMRPSAVLMGHIRHTYSPSLESAVVPDVEAIVTAIRNLCAE